MLPPEQTKDLKELSDTKQKVIQSNDEGNKKRDPVKPFLSRSSRLSPEDRIKEMFNDKDDK